MFPIFLTGSKGAEPLPVLNYFLSSIISFVFPRICEICGDVHASPDLICSSCILSLNTNHHARASCPRCGQNQYRQACLCHIACDLRTAAILPLFDYDSSVRAAAHALKYQGVKGLGRFLGRYFLPLLPRQYFSSFDLVTAVPLHPSRKKTRGYNQAEVLARGFLLAAGHERLYRELLIRTRRNNSQTTLDKQARNTNQRGAFSCRRGTNLAEARILLVDDVVTTGATVEACAETLLAAGAASVSVFCLARD